MTVTPSGGGDQSGAAAHAPETKSPETQQPKRAPDYLHYNRSNSAMGWGVALVVLAQFALGLAAFDTIRHAPGVAAPNDYVYGASGLDIALVIFGVLAGAIGLLTLVVGVVNMAGNIDLVAWSARERMRAAAIAAGLDQPNL